MGPGNQVKIIQNSTVSVIIPTYNRPELLQRLLTSLRLQSYPPGLMEIIVVNDGSDVQYNEWMGEMSSRGVIFLWQENQGEAIARNLGAQSSKGELLLFLDDDIEIMPDYIAAMVLEHASYPQAILIGNMRTALPDGASVFARIITPELTPYVFGPVPFTEILGGVVGVSRRIYLELGGMQPVPDRQRGMWIDIDFAYRAHKAGYTFRRVERALALHHDHVYRDLQSACQRVEKLARLTPGLFQCHPELSYMIPMFRDMQPLAFGQEKVFLSIRKMLRKISSLKLVVRSMEGIVAWLEKSKPSPLLLRPLYRWVSGAYIYRGFQIGLREFRCTR